MIHFEHLPCWVRLGAPSTGSAATAGLGSSTPKQQPPDWCPSLPSSNRRTGVRHSQAATAGLEFSTPRQQPPDWSPALPSSNRRTGVRHSQAATAGLESSTPKQQPPDWCPALPSSNRRTGVRHSQESGMTARPAMLDEEIASSPQNAPHNDTLATLSWRGRSPKQSPGSRGDRPSVSIHLYLRHGAGRTGWLRPGLCPRCARPRRNTLLDNRPPRSAVRQRADCYPTT